MSYQIITVLFAIIASSSFLLNRQNFLRRFGSKLFARESNSRRGDDERVTKKKKPGRPGQGSKKHPKKKWKRKVHCIKEKKDDFKKPMAVSFLEYPFEVLRIIFNSIFVQSNKHGKVKPTTIQFIAMDCEMVGCGRNGSESLLARCSLVSLGDSTSREPTNVDARSDAKVVKNINVLYDVYVKPTKNVTDYRTQYSGITAKHLEREEAVSWDKCHSDVKKVLESTNDKRVVLIGHGLENDFQVLKYWHPRRFVRDTATFHHFMRQGRRKLLPRKLSSLAEEHLGVKIQSNKDMSQFIDINYGEYESKYSEHSEGHSSIEDAAAALLLYHKFSEQWEDSLGNPLENRGD